MNHQVFRARPAYLLLATLTVIALVFWPARAVRSQDFVFYLPNQRKVLAVQMIGSTAYLPLIPLLNIAGQVTALQEKRGSLRVWFGGAQLRFRQNQSRIQINKSTVTLPAPVVQADGQWMVPSVFLSAVLPHLTGQHVAYRPGTYRAFLGSVQPISYTVSLGAQASGARLVVRFTGKISIQTASTNGKWIVFLGDAPIEPLEQHVSFQNPYVKALDFDDHDGRPKLIITPGEMGLNFYPQLADGGTTFVADLVKPQALAQPGPPGAVPKAPIGPPAAAPPGAKPSGPQAPAAPPPLPSIVIDPGHGGNDAGARSRDGILEKNVTAQIAIKLAADISATKKYRVILTRTGDTDPSIEQRTLSANTAQPVAFITLHAGELGDRSPVAAVYTYQAGAPFAAGGQQSRVNPLFVRWDVAQQPQMSKSQQLAGDIQQQLARSQGVNAPAPQQAPVRQLRSIAAPAVAIEVGTLSPDEPAGQINTGGFQGQVAAAITAALQQFLPGGAAK